MSNSKDFKVKNGIKPTVYNEGMGTVVSGSVGYSLATASYDSKSFVPSPSSGVYGVFLKSDGSKLYVMNGNTNIIYQHSLSPAWDVSTASYDSVSLDVSGQTGTIYSAAFNSGGTKLYTLQSQTVYQYTLSTAWDVSTASYDSKSLLVSGQDTSPFGIALKSDGTSLYMVGRTSDAVYQYDLSTAYDLNTASYSGKNLSLSSQDTNPNSIDFSADGLSLFMGGSTSTTVYKYDLGTAWDVSTASYYGSNYATTTQAESIVSFKLSSDGLKAYMLGSNSGVYEIFQYSTTLNTASLDLSTGSVFEITPTSDIQISLSNPAASGTVSAATLLLSASGTAYTITYDTSLQWSGGTAPTSPAIGETDVLTFNTDDGGTTYKAVQAIDGAS